MGNLDGKVAVITGAASGNGRGTAMRFAAEGADIVIADLDRPILFPDGGITAGMYSAAAAQMLRQ